MTLALPIALPLLSAFMLPLVSRANGTAGRLFGPLMVAANLFVGLALWQKTSELGPRHEALGGFAAPLGIQLYGDQLALLVVVITSLLVLLLWPRGKQDPVREPTLTLMLLAGSCGIALSGDLFNLFVFYELVAVASYGLVASAGTGPAYLASLRFLVLSAAGSAFALLGIGLVYSITGTLNLAYLSGQSSEVLDSPLGLSAFALMLIGFGVKAELFPVNTWVPEVYAAATSRVAGLLSGVVSKLALLILLKLLLGVFDTEAAHRLLLVLGVLTLLSGELAAYRARDLRRVLAYSSIAQLGLVAIAFSVSGAAGVLAGIALALHHYLAKPALFLLAESWGGRLALLAGAARRSPLAAGLFVLTALSLIGVPPLPGFWAKYLLLGALFESGHGAYYLAAALLLVTTVIEAAYLMRIVGHLFEPADTGQKPHARCELMPATLLVSCLAMAAVAAAPLADGLSQVAGQAVAARSQMPALTEQPLAMEERP